MKIIDKIFLQKIEITTIALNNAIKSGLADIAASFLQKGVQPNITSLVNACFVRHSGIINSLLLCKLTPNKDCFDALLSSASYYNNDATQIANIIDTLIQHGYTLTYSDVVNALNKRQHINNIGRFGFKFKPDILQICSRLSYYPYNEKDIGVKPTIECLRIECEKTGNISTLRSLINDNKLKPDIECLRNACKIKSNITNIKFLK